MKKHLIFWPQCLLQELPELIQREFGKPAVLCIPDEDLRKSTREVYGADSPESVLEDALMLYPNLHWHIRPDVIFVYDAKTVRERDFSGELELDLAYGSDVMGESFATRPIRVMGFAARTFRMNFILGTEQKSWEHEAAFSLKPKESMGKVLGRVASQLGIEWKDTGACFLASPVRH